MKDGTIVQPLTSHIWKHRDVKAKRDFAFPPPVPDPATMDGSALSAILWASDSDLVRTLATKLNIGGKYSEELCARTGFADPTQGGNMRDWYDNPVLEDIFAEQAQMLSYGPLGALGNASVELTEELPSEALALMQDYLKGQIGTMEFVTKAEAIRLRNAPVQLARPEA